MLKYRTTTALVMAVVGLSVTFPLAQTAPQLVQSSDLAYQGAFRLPGGQLGPSSFSYGGSALAYNPATNSLYVSGHTYQDMTAEVSIPEIRQSANVSSLATATMIQGFADSTDGLQQQVDQHRLGGLQIYNGKLYSTAYTYYDAGSTAVASHFSNGLNLAVNNDARGPFKVGDMNPGFYGGYMASVPSEWQAALGGPVVTGQCCLSIITRTSFGPALFAIDPTNLGTQNPLPARPLLYYDEAHPNLGGWGQTNPNFNGTTFMGGVVLPPGTRSALFFGVHGTGTFCYGDGSQCPDPSGNSKGNHAYPYKYQVWAYDINDFIKVRNGQMQPYNVMPYSVWNFTLPYTQYSRDMGGLAYDAVNKRIFIYQNATGEQPVIHVFLVTGATGVPGAIAPLPPKNVRIVSN